MIDQNDDIHYRLLNFPIVRQESMCIETSKKIFEAHFCLMIDEKYDIHHRLYF